MSADLAFDFETLSAYVDDEVDEGTRNQVEAALARDPELSYPVSYTHLTLPTIYSV